MKNKIFKSKFHTSIILKSNNFGLSDTGNWSIKEISKKKNATQEEREKMKESLIKSASLTQLTLKNIDENKLVDNFSQIISCVQTIQELDTTNVSPLRTFYENRNMIQREDVEDCEGGREKILLNSKHKNIHPCFFIVPKVHENH